MTTLVVLAKAPRAGHAKTRLCPPCTPEQAAALAEAALADTLAAVAATPADRRILVLDGPPGAWLPGGMEVVLQGEGTLGERIADALEHGSGLRLIVGMDTPQLTPDHLLAGLAALGDHDAVIGPASDGGYWTLGLRTPDRRVLDGVPMSTPDTCAAQLARLRELGRSTAVLQTLEDVDTIAGARRVAAAAPGTRFARALGAI